MTSIGIDLGTTYSCVAFMKDGKAEVIANDQGQRITPSVVSFTDEERLVGEGAKRQMAKNPKNTIYDAKRLIGRKFADPAVQSDIRRWLFLVTNDGGKPKIKVEYKGDEKTLHPEEVSAAVLEKMKSIAQDFIGGEIHSAVITVPAYFGDAQRRATKDAADIAGLHVLGMINEPTAAAIAYGLDRKTDSKRNVLIFDVGGGTFDVTVMTIQDMIYKVRATGGNSHLGGQDINDRLYNYFVADFVKKNKTDLTERAKHRIRVQCEQVKRMLSTTRKASSVVDHLHGEKDFNMEITRAKFEQLCEDLFRGTIETVEKVLEDAQMQKEEIDDVVLVGGSTRIPVLQEMLEEYFGEGKISKKINPDEAVACGAAIKAAFLSGDISAAMEGMKLEDVIPLSLGVETKGGIMTFVVEKNTKIPTKKYKTIITTVDNQESISYPVFEGERTLTKLNTELGSFTLSGLPRLPAGQAKTEICFNIDENGVLNVTARDMSKQGNEAKLKITWDKGRFGEEELKRMYEEARNFRREDDINKQTVIARNDLETLGIKGQRIVRQARQGTESQRYSLKKRCTDVLEWLEENPNAMLPEVKAKNEKLKEALRLIEGIGGLGTV